MILKNINDNPISNEWKKRYFEQSVDVQKKLDALDKMNPKEYQLRVIKKTKNKISDGDVFLLSPRENKFFYGKVLKANIDHLEKDEFIHGKNLVFILKCKTTKITIDDYKPDYTKLLIMPTIVDNSYWNKGFFYTVGNVAITEDEKTLDYGFYKIGVNSGWYCKEDGRIIENKPMILGTYGIATITGVASKIEKELIINSDLLKSSKLNPNLTK